MLATASPTPALSPTLSSWRRINAPLGGPLVYTIRCVALRLLLAVLLIWGTPASAAPIVSPEMQRGITWLEAQVTAGATVQGEDSSLAQVNQVRCETALALGYFNPAAAVPRCEFNALDIAEIRARADYIPVEFWRATGGVTSTAEFDTISSIDTLWGLSQAFGRLVDVNPLNSIALVYSLQTPAGGFSLNSNIASVPFTALAGSALVTNSDVLTSDQRQKLRFAADWLLRQSTRANYWDNAYQTALVHLFLVSNIPNASRDLAIFENLQSEQLPNGSWANDPYLTALVLRALGTRSTAFVSESGYTVRVLDAASLQPLIGATVNGVVVGSDGRVTTKLSPSPNVAVTIQSNGYVTQSRTAAIALGVMTDLGDAKMVVDPSGFVLAGTVVDASSRAAIADVAIYETNRGLIAFTDSNGRYAMVGGSSGPLRLTTSVSNYEPTTVVGDVVLGQRYQMDLQLALTSTAPEDASVTGVVRDKATRAVLPNASVEWTSTSGRYASVTTDGQGVYVLSSLRPESGTLVVSLSGYLGVTVAGVRAASPISTTQDFDLESVPNAPADGRVGGTIRDVVTNSLVEGATVRLINTITGIELASTASDGLGAFAFSAVPFDAYRVVLEKAGYQGAEATVTLTPSAPSATIQGTIRRLVSKISGRVIDAATSQTLAGANVIVGTWSATTNAFGMFDFPEIPAGSYTLSVTAQGYGNGDKPIVVLGLGAQSVGDLPLAKIVVAGEIAGTVTDAKTNLPVAGAIITSGTVSTQSGADGTYLLTPVSAGTAQVRVTADGFFPKTVSLVITEARRYRADIAVDKLSDNTLSLVVSTDRPSYKSYSAINVSTVVRVPTSYPRTPGQLDVRLVNSQGTIVAFSRYAWRPRSYDFFIQPADPPATYPIVLGSENLPPGRYSVESRLYEMTVVDTGPRASLAVATATIDIEETRALASVTTTALPSYANYLSVENTATRIRVVNRSNVAVTPTFTVTLRSPTGAVVSTATRSVDFRVDELVKDIDIPTGTVSFSTAGLWPVSVAVADVPTLSAPTLDKTTVVPGIRIEVRKDITPSTITPDSERRVRVGLHIKGVQP